MSPDDAHIPPLPVDPPGLPEPDPQSPDAMRPPRRRPRPHPTPADADRLAGHMHDNFVYLQRQLRLLRTRQNAFEAAKARLLELRQQLQSQLAETDAQRASFEERREELEAREGDMALQRASLDALAARITQRTEDVRRRADQAEAREAHLAHRAAEVDDRQRQLDDDRRTLASALADAATLRENLAADRQEVEQWLARLQEQQRRMRQQQLELDERDTVVTQRLAEVAATAKAQVDAAAMLDAARDELAQHRAALEAEQLRQKQRHADLTRRAAALVDAEAHVAHSLAQIESRAQAALTVQRPLHPALLMALDDATTRELPLTEPLCLIGRDATCDLRIALPSLSRVHCVVYRRGESLRVRDLGSTNGTFVNDQKIDDAPLKAGDILGFGELAMTLRVEGKPRRAASAVVAAQVLRRVTARAAGAPAGGGREK